MPFEWNQKAKGALTRIHHQSSHRGQGSRDRQSSNSRLDSTCDHCRKWGESSEEGQSGGSRTSLSKKRGKSRRVGFHLGGRTYRRTSAIFQTKGSSCRTFPRSARSIRWRHQHTISHSRRTGVGRGRFLGNTTTLAVIPKFVRVAHKVGSHHRRSEECKKSKGGDKARKAKHGKKNGGGKRATSDWCNTKRQKVNGLMFSWGSPFIKGCHDRILAMAPHGWIVYTTRYKRS